jgi:hypothetical protein
MTPGTNTDQIIKTSADMFAKQLTSTWTRKKKPYGFDDALEQAHKAPSADTGQIFLSYGFHIWLAYFLVTIALKPNAQHYIGQHTDRDTWQNFEKLSFEHQKEVASRLGRVTIDASVQTAINQLQIDGPRNGRKRRRKFHYIQFVILKLNIIGSNTPESSGSAQDSITLTTMSEEPEVTPLQHDHNHTISDHERNYTTDTTHATVPCSTAIPLPRNRDGQSVSGPQSTLVATIFPQYLCGAIRKTAYIANITMVFPYHFSDNRVDCLMSLAILPNRVQYLARELFGMNLETEGKLRYIVYENGSRILPIDAVLHGAHEEAIVRLLGSRLSSAISRSPMRKDEIRQGTLATSCVTLRISGGCEEDAILNLNLASEEAFQLQDALFVQTVPANRI